MYQDPTPNEVLEKIKMILAGPGSVEVKIAAIRYIVTI